MHKWGMSPDYQWEYRVPPYRGVLVPAQTADNGRSKAYEAYIETPKSRYRAPHLFPEMGSAKQWVEQHIEQLLHAEHEGSGI